MKLKELIEKYGEYEVKNEDRLKELLKSPNPKTVWDLDIDEKYYWTNNLGDIHKDTANDVIFKQRKEIGSAFLTEEDAKKELKRRKCEALLKKYADGHEFKYGECNYYLYATGMTATPRCGVNYNEWIKEPHVYFASNEDAWNAVKEIGEKRLLRDYFQIEV